jgi:hypothetical protein
VVEDADEHLLGDVVGVALAEDSPDVLADGAPVPPVQIRGGGVVARLDALDESAGTVVGSTVERKCSSVPPAGGCRPPIMPSLLFRGPSLQRQRP